MEKNRKDLAEYRLAKAKEHLKSAEYLFQKDCFMDSISRSYYAIFAAARSMLAFKEMDSSKHAGVISLFNQHLVKTGILSINCSKIIQESKILERRQITPIMRLWIKRWQKSN